MKIALIGYGKMGRMIEDIALQRAHEIVCKIDIDNQEDFDSAAFKSADVAIEFTNYKVAYENCLKAFEHNVKVVSGSTGWMQKHGDEMKRMCLNKGKTLFWASNFSVGVAIFGAVNKYLAKIMNRFSEYDVSIEEIHHIHKLDAPSGTAITLAEQVIDNLDRKTDWELATETNQQHNSSILPVTSFREGEVPGIHTVKYNSDADQIMITHDAHSRQGFALGAVLAAEYTAKHSGWLTMLDLFDF